MIMATYEALSLRISAVLSTVGESKEHEIEDGSLGIYR